MQGREEREGRKEREGREVPERTDARAKADTTGNRTSRLANALAARLLVAYATSTISMGRIDGSAASLDAYPASLLKGELASIENVPSPVMRDDRLTS